MILDDGDMFTQDVAPFDETKFFKHAASKKSAGLPHSYCLESVN